MGAVNLAKIRKSFGTVDVIKGVDLNIKDGEFVALVGASGCGKSTLLRMIAGLESVSGGSISIAGRDVTTLPPKQRDIAMVFQNYALYPNMTVAQNMAFSLRLKNVPMAEREVAVNRAAEILDLIPLLGRFPRELSGGQRQRVAMGRAIVRNPEVFLFDEPLSNLDAKLRVHMRGEIKSLHQRLGTTMIYVTHDQIEAMTMADRIVVMNGGVVEQAGSPLEIYDAPRTRYVAGFIGSPSMNFFDGTVEQTTNGQVLRIGPDHVLPAPSGITLEIGQVVTCGVRPEHFVLGNEGLPVTVELVEPTGSETTLVVQAGSISLTCLVRERLNIRPKEQLHFAVSSSHVHLFDKQTGISL